MDDLIAMISTDASAADISDKIKEILHGKAAENVEAVRPAIAADMFGMLEPLTSNQDSEEDEEW